ncbi:MAG: glycosyl transferase [Pseudomonadota bacterium]|nr:glycosyl transferase [Pseudomonadota bacterium]
MLQQNQFDGQSLVSPSELESYGFYRNWSAGDLLAHAERFNAEGSSNLAAALYKNWIACNPGSDFLHAAYFNYSFSLAKAGDRLGAIAAARECLRLKPDFFPIYVNLGRLLEDAGQLGEAVEQWRAMIEALPQIRGEIIRNKLTALEQMARVLEAHNIDGPAEEAMRLSLDISIHQPSVIQHYIALRQRQCKWPAAQGWDGVPAERLMAGISPLSVANLSNDPLFQLARSATYYRELVGPMPPAVEIPPPLPAAERKPGRLRIGYVSSDFREHAVGFAMTDVLETHSKDQFEIFAYYCGIAREDGIKQRCRDAVDHWIDINDLTDEAAARRIRDDEIDILIDLNGFTKSARSKVFSLRPAPVIVNWFGFPGSMGSPDHHYLIADERIVPEASERYFTEKVVRLTCYQPNDRKRIVAAPPQRADEGLPDDAFVFCSLNGAQKFTPVIFAGWLAILKAVPDSVLWLFGGVGDTNDRLRGLARDADVAPERLIFAEKKANPHHVARYALADLFLDTFPYGSHTTAADALYMGLPVLTFAGRTFASRVCASLVHAAGIGELVCASYEQYVASAIALAQNRGALGLIKQRLVNNRDTCRLFDTPKLVRELEDAFRAMHADYAEGRRPTPNLNNIGYYHEIGVALSAGELSDEAYLPVYTHEIARRHAISPLPADGRAWDGGEE